MQRQLGAPSSYPMANLSLATLERIENDIPSTSRLSQTRRRNPSRKEVIYRSMPWARDYSSLRTSIVLKVTTDINIMSVKKREDELTSRAIHHTSKHIGPQPHPLAQQHTLCNCNLLDSQDQVVTNLGCETGPRRTTMDDLGTHVGKVGLCQSERRSGTAD